VTPIEGSPAITIDKHLLANADEDGTGDVSIGDTLTPCPPAYSPPLIPTGYSMT
jgi:hypothetical protein